MISIPIFDSLTHPTIDGNWIMPKYEEASKIEDLVVQMNENNIINAFAVGMNGIGSYTEKGFISLFNKYENFFIPIAYFDLKDTNSKKNIKNQLQSIKKQGYKGIKLHPRFSNFSLENELLPYVILYANELNLIVLLCTYFYDNAKIACSNSIEKLAGLLQKIDESKIILLHSGAVRFLEMIEIARVYKNVLLDLSFTLCKYEDSSIDLDIQFAYNTFDQRICIGSDYPQYSCLKLRERFNHFAKHISQEKAENIAFKNIQNFI